MYMLIHSAILLKYQFKRVPEKFRCCQTPLLYKMGGVNQPQVKKLIKSLFFITVIPIHVQRHTNSLTVVVFLNIVKLHGVIYVETMRF